MISDVLSQAVIDIQEYLDHEGTRDCYHGRIREDIERLVAEMDAMRRALDVPPSATPDYGRARRALGPLASWPMVYAEAHEAAFREAMRDG